MTKAERNELDRQAILANFLAIIGDGRDEQIDELVRYLDHCGISARDIQHAGNWGAAVLRHYLTLDGFDIERAAQDLLRWPAVKDAVHALEAKASGKKQRRMNGAANSQII